MKYAIITGVSGGLGFDTARFLLESGIHLFGISRTDQESLYDIAGENHVEYTHYSCDLSVPEDVDKTVNKLLYAINHLDENDHLYLINNAAAIHPIKQSTKLSQQELTDHYQVNVLSPIYLMNQLLAKSCEKQVSFVGVNITSGAAVNPLFGWSAYCSAKASMNMYTKTIALEQDELNTGNKIIAFNPGIMDTKMQEKIRNADKKDFLQVEQFKQYKLQGVLSQTESVAGVLIDIMTDEVNIINGEIYHIDDYT